MYSRLYRSAKSGSSRIQCILVRPGSLTALTVVAIGFMGILVTTPVLPINVAIECSVVVNSIQVCQS